MTHSYTSKLSKAAHCLQVLRPSPKREPTLEERLDRALPAEPKWSQKDYYDGGGDFRNTYTYADPADGVMVCCNGHETPLTHFNGQHPFKIVKCSTFRCEHILCKQCRTTEILTPISSAEMYAIQHQRRDSESTEVRFCRICQNCGLSHRASYYGNSTSFPHLCACGVPSFSSEVLYFIGSVDAYHRDPQGRAVQLTLERIYEKSDIQAASSRQLPADHSKAESPQQQALQRELIQPSQSAPPLPLVRQSTAPAVGIPAEARPLRMRRAATSLNPALPDSVKMLNQHSFFHKTAEAIVSAKAFVATKDDKPKVEMPLTLQELQRRLDKAMPMEKPWDMDDYVAAGVENAHICKAQQHGDGLWLCHCGHENVLMYYRESWYLVPAPLNVRKREGVVRGLTDSATDVDLPASAPAMLDKKPGLPIADQVERRPAVLQPEDGVPFWPEPVDLDELEEWCQGVELS
ncbi:hypothetical protein BKA63DRAFT_576859 [Paraphoma chrysanthemicola]|nr:hypothetical protein BKA63DRAFT_576859 [Paraphoma chrysanthemicola]